MRRSSRPAPPPARSHRRTGLGPGRFLTEAKKPHSLVLYCLAQGWMSLLRAHRVLLCSAPVGVSMARTGSQRSVAHTPQGRGVSFCRSRCAPRAGHLSRVRRVGPAGRGDQHTPSIGARLPPSPLCAVPSSARPRRAELCCPPPARALPWH